MAKQLLMEPSGWHLPLRECPPGPFCWVADPHAGGMGWASEYGDAYNIGGERISDVWLDAMVQPLCPVWLTGNDNDGWERAT